MQNQVQLVIRTGILLASVLIWAGFSSEPIQAQTTTRPRAPFKVIYSNDTTNVYSCTSPYHPARVPFSTAALQGSIDETANTGIEVHMLQPGVGWVPWWESTILPNHYQWFMDTYQVWPDSFGLYMMNGGDIVQEFVDRCQQKGLVPFISYRLNDGHRLDNVDDLPGEIPNGAGNNITQFYKENPEYRIGTNLNDWYQRVQNWAIPEVRNYKLAFIEEIIENYDIDGFELDFMRMCSLFPQDTTTSAQRQSIVTSVVAEVRQYLDDNTDPGDYKWLCVRVPGYLETHDALGIDIPSMVAAGVDMVNLSSYFFTDQQEQIAEVVSMVPNTPVYLEMTNTPITGSPIPGVYDSYPYRRATLEQFYTTAHLAYAQGAAGITMFNFAYYREHGADLEYIGPFHEPPFEVFEHLGDPNWLALQDHHYFMAGTWNNPPRTTSRQLEQIFNAGETHTFTLQMAPGAYADGKLRIRGFDSLGSSVWQVSLNGQSLTAASDVSELFDSPYDNFLGEDEDYRAWLVPQELIADGDNTVAVTMVSGATEKITWIDIMLPEWMPDPVMELDAAEAGNNANSHWKPSIGSGTGELVDAPAIQADTNAPGDYTWSYRFNAPDTTNDQVLDIGSHSDLSFVDDNWCTIEAWVRLPGQINNSKNRGVILGNIDGVETGWRFGVRCNTTTGKYACEFQQRDNETAQTSWTGILHYLTDYCLDYSSTEWAHIVFIKYAAEYTGGNISVNHDWYINGELESHGVRVLPASSLADLFFTRQSPASQHLPQRHVLHRRHRSDKSI